MTCPDLGSRHLLDLTPGTREPDAQRRRVPKSHPPHQDDPDGASPSIGVGAPAQQDPEAMQGARMASSGRQVHRRHAILQHQAGVRPELQQLLHSPAADGDSGHQSFGRPGSRRQGRTSVPRSPRIFLAQCDQQFPGSVGHVPAVSQPSDSNLRGDFCARAAPPPRLPSPASGNALGTPWLDRQCLEPLTETGWVLDRQTAGNGAGGGARRWGPIPGFGKLSQELP